MWEGGGKSVVIITVRDVETKGSSTKIFKSVFEEIIQRLDQMFKLHN